MKTFIRVCEIWVPSRDRTVLEFQGGLYGPLKHFRAASERMCFGYDEGLPGKAWLARHPIILKDLQHSYFKRAQSAGDAGLTCAVAIPVFAGDYLLAVVVLFCGDDEDHVGAIELWHNDPARSHDMSLVDGYYGIADSFEYLSHHTQFRPGFGLPGLVWNSGMPEVMADLCNAEQFLRKDDARKVGLTKGLGLPSLYAPGQNYVLTFLSALGTPIARRFEVWVPDATREALIFHSGHCDATPDLGRAYAAARVHPGDSLIGVAWLSGIPTVSEAVAECGSAAGLSAREAGLEAALALPVLDQGRLKAVVAFYF